MLHVSRTRWRLLAFSSAMLLAMVATAASSAHPRARKASNGGLSVSTLSNWGGNNHGINLYTLKNGHGMKVTITNYGGVVQSIQVPDSSGKVRNVALGFSRLQDYQRDFTQGATQTPWPLPGGSGDTYFGAIIGRYANRIASASFTLNNSTYKLDANNGPNTLHGGYLGWNTQTWDASTASSPKGVSVILTKTLPQGEGCLPTLSPGCTGFPAAVKATVTYTLTRNNALRIHYNAVNQSSSLATVINLTNHTYFNLAGEGSGTVYGQLLRINANRYQPVDTNLIPIGFANVGGTPFDFRTMKPIGRDIRRVDLPDGTTGQQFPQLVIAHGYDHNWVLNHGAGPAAVAEDRGDGIVLTTFTDQPGVQVYTGNFLVGDLTGTSGRTYRQSDAFTLETQHFPDSPHHIGQAGWPSVVLNPSGTFASTTTYRFSTLARRGPAFTG